MLQRNKLEVHNLHGGPNIPIRLKRSPPTIVKFLFGIGTFENSLDGEEEGCAKGREEELVGGHARENLGISGGEFDAFEDFVPLANHGGEDGCGSRG